MRIQVKDFMSAPVTTVIGEDRVEEVRQTMKEQGIHAVPVISYSKEVTQVEVAIRGIVTASDLNDDMNANATVEDIMTSSRVHVVHVDSTAQAAAKMMLKHKVHHIVVMDEGKIVGMVSSLDFVKLVAEHSLG